MGKDTTQQADEAALELTVGSKQYSVRLRDLTGRDVRDFRREFGFAPTHVFANPSQLDIDVYAGLIWLERRRQDPKLTLEQVLGEVTYDNLDFADAGEDVAEDASNPEA